LCGIIGYTGAKAALPLLLDGLARLEYRGYDSAGVALLPGLVEGRVPSQTQGQVQSQTQRQAQNQAQIQVQTRIQTQPNQLFLTNNPNHGPNPFPPILDGGDGRAGAVGVRVRTPAVTLPVTLVVRKAAGRLDRLHELLQEHPPEQELTTGIGHTRWATHGPPTDANAHPHLDCRGRVAVVHNGIIENSLALREELLGRGHGFSSQTDTEVVAHLLEEALAEGQAMYSAWLRVLGRLVGAFALAAVTVDEPGSVWLARFSSPLVVGRGADGWFVASDIPALLPYTREVYVLQDREAGVLTPERARFFTFGGESVEKRPQTVAWEVEQAERGGFADFMLKEIHEEPAVVRRLFTRYFPAAGDGLALGLPWGDLWWAERRKLWIVASGTAAHAGLMAKHWFERIAGLPVEFDVASEFRTRKPLLSRRDLALVISQSGETADTLAGLRLCRSQGVPTLGIVNVATSSIAREADAVLLTEAGPEIAVASTKAYVAQLVVLALLAIHVARVRARAVTGVVAGAGGTPVVLPEDSGTWRQQLERGLTVLPTAIEDLLGRQVVIDPKVVEKIAGSDHVFYIGRGLDHAAAVEAALKLKEISYIHAEAYAAGELKHGPLALISPGTPVIGILTQDELVSRTLANLHEVKARHGWVVGVGSQLAVGSEEAAFLDAYVKLPALPAPARPLLAAPALQLLAYQVARARNTDVDRPRNLAKSVTVE